MVDSVRNSPNVGGLTVHDQKKSNASSGQANQLPGNGNTQADKSSVSVDLSLSEKVSSLAGSPPINMELVNEIREKVQQGRYPIDLDSISSKLFESIQDAEG
jgi:flagellar biosynthesis anti-sigma factor FlgM|tara:strand:- start:203 stop:508 length:306 start_codon:yes stop_codon:yes gene_type:complete